jgi:type IV secretion system protein VirB9
MKTKLLALALLACTMSTAAFAQSDADRRIRTLPYNENAVVALTGHLGYQMMIEFKDDERIENVSIGDSLAWQVTPNRRATLLFVKPIEAGAATNMTVVTSLRRYVFELRAAEPRGPNDPAITYVLRFAYPAPPPAPVVVKPPPPPPPPIVRNTAYSQKGSAKIAPREVWDDGRFTYFAFAELLEAPVIAAVGPDGREGLVNSRNDGATVIVDAIAPAFVLRHGKERLTITNDALAGPRSP